MDISRKDFFKKSLYSLGEAITTVTGALKEPQNERPTIPDTADYVPAANENMQAVACKRAVPGQKLRLLCLL